MRFGKGIYKWTDGSFYDGEWKADKMNGRGVYRSVEGLITKGVFEDDNLIAPIYDWIRMYIEYLIISCSIYISKFSS